MKLDKKTILKIVFWAIAAPIIVNIIMFIPSFGLAASTTDNWLSFFGNYSGGIVGGIVAYIIAASQIKAQNDEKIKDEIKNSRSYIILEEFIAPVDLKGVITHNNSKILSNKFYEEIKKDPNSKHKSIPFYKIHHSGLPEIILDCEIKVILHGEGETAGKIPYLVESHLSVFEKNTEIFIPVARKDFKHINPKRVTVSYSTIKGEKILYVYDVDKMEEKHVLINLKDRNKDRVLHRVKLKGVTWIYPAKFNDHSR
ncbi:MAG: hypothetical protein C6W57_03345 [Caldibacillus debilis]|uniref:hypothetical protein n=1 Tax=Caldibacillus debilis TaxID=301148 RepID=UPI000E37CDAE|nr:hypothetical protein [Caldibacillus debilis]REJ18656.1 MAG: hypothetical protein C6W57_03345 [Caldibacillus debilis]